MSNRPQIALTTLRWSVGLVVVWESCRFVFSAAAAHHFSRLGFPHWIRPGLGIAEIIAAILFLTPNWERFGGYSLLLIFTFAGILHVLHSQLEIGPLFVYSAAVLVCVWVKPAGTRSTL